MRLVIMFNDPVFDPDYKSRLKAVISDLFRINTLKIFNGYIECIESEKGLTKRSQTRKNCPKKKHKFPQDVFIPGQLKL
ncbi:MAG: hypothetical protein RIT43_2485 [Bacteroidota bacterium]